MPDVLDRIVDGLNRATTRDDLSAQIVALRDHFDVGHLVYHALNGNGGQYAVLTYDDAWAARYVERDYARVDPVVHGCLRQFEPVHWSDLDWTGKAVRDFSGEAAEAGVGARGLSVPIRGPGGQFAMFTVNDGQSERSWERFTREHLNDLLLVAHFTNQKALELEGAGPAPPPPLSPRETDALTLLALGRSRAQAADDLRISEHTLRVYIESARHKLGASNTTQAVARALVAGAIVI
jgi:DNA-binding CsgD family transcriptional regulator